jgi:glucose-1-phosphate cytidylyltransferase
MKTVILAGGMGTRLSEETVTKPKPMVEIGDHPIIWHIMKGYSAHNFRDFVLALGYKGEHLKRYFAEYASLAGDLSIHTKEGRIEYREPDREDWQVDLVDTGHNTETGGRLLRVAHLLGDRFMVTFGDGVSNVDINALVAFHEAHGKLATVTAVRPPARFGHVELDGNQVKTFDEKPQAGEGWINGGFFVLERKVLDYIDDDLTYFQKEPLERLAKEGELMAFKHTGFWQCMDTVRDRDLLQSLWSVGDAPWKTW